MKVRNVRKIGSRVGGSSVVWTRALAGIAALGLAWGCGDDGPSKPGVDGRELPLFDTHGNFDVNRADTTSRPDTSRPDTQTSDTRRDTTQLPDLIQDNTPPSIVSTTPAAAAEYVGLPLTVTIVFSEELFPGTVAPQSIKLIDWLNKEVPGTPVLQADKKTVIWKPTTNDQQLASSYTIRVMGNIIADPSGNRMEQTREFTFTTASYANQGPLTTLASRYAPNIISAVAGGAGGQFQVPVKLDADGDWNLTNNRAWITTGATSLLPVVHYSVSETYTHYFLTYALYFPYVNHSGPTFITGNAMTGVLVVVEKARGEAAERPVAAYTYWKEGVNEENYAFVTEESGIVPSGSTASAWGIKAVLPQATLFPNGHFNNYVTAQTHRSCAWDWNEGGSFPRCPVGQSERDGDRLVFEYIDGVATAVVKSAAGAWPAKMADVAETPDAFGYALVPIFGSLWPRRVDTPATEMYEPDTFTFTPDSGRAGGTLKLSTRFIQSVASADVTAFGKPIWSWGWKPNVVGPNDLVDAITRGQMLIDPAWYVWERHHRQNTPNALTAYDATTGTGFSTTYCFNGYTATDVRTIDPKCVPTP